MILFIVGEYIYSTKSRKAEFFEVMGKAVMITSFKGGVGKSTVAVNLAAGLAFAGYKTLIVDLDFSSGSVDLFMGCEHDALYSFCDVAERRVTLIEAVYAKKSEAGKAGGGPGYFLDVLKAPPSYDMSIPFEKAAGEFVEETKDLYDFIIFDCPSGKFPLFDILAKTADSIFVVTLHSAASVRAAEKLAFSLSENGGKSENVRLIINGFNPGGVAKGLNLGIVDIIEHSKIKLIGLIETNYHIRNLQETGKTVYDVKNKKLKTPFEDIIGRFLDNNIILNKKYDGYKTERLYFKKEIKKPN